jgi:hypothetical protein
MGHDASWSTALDTVAGGSMDRFDLVLAGIDGAILRLNETEGDAFRAYLATGEALFWIGALDDVLLDIDGHAWRARRGALVQGLKYARNVAAHELDAWVQPAEDLWSDRWWDDWYDFAWRAMPEPRSEQWRRQFAAYQERIEGRSVRDTLADARDLARDHLGLGAGPPPSSD